MKKCTYLFAIIIIIISINACSKNSIDNKHNSKIISENERLLKENRKLLSENDNLTKNNDTLISEIIEYEKVAKHGELKDIILSYEPFLAANVKVLDFTRAYINKDINTLKILTPSIVEKNNSILEVFETELIYPDINNLSSSINTFVYNSKSKELFIEIFLENVKASKSYGFLNFTLKKKDLNDWYIINIERDI